METTTAQPTMAELKTQGIECAKQMGALVKSAHGLNIDLARLIIKAKDAGYHTACGFANFEDYVARYSGVGVMPREAAYLENILRKADKLGIAEKTLREIERVKLKSIFRLDPRKEADAAAIHALLKVAKKSHYKAIEEAVNRYLKTGTVEVGAKPTESEKSKPEAPAATGGSAGTAKNKQETVTVSFELTPTQSEVLSQALKATDKENNIEGLMVLANVFLAYKASITPQEAPVAVAA